MRKSKIYCFSVIFIALFLLFTIIVFSEQSTSGFSNSFQQGFETGFKIGQKIKEKKLKEEQQKKLDDMKMKIDESINIFINLVKQYGEDNIYSETEKIQLNLIFLSFIPEIQMVLKNLNDSIQLMENEQDELNENKWSYKNPDSSLKYNPFEDKWEYAPPGSTLKYNAFEDKWEYASTEEKAKYNPYENNWSYESPDSSLKYNPFEDKWEYAPPGSTLKYNPFSDSWWKW